MKPVRFRIVLAASIIAATSLTSFAAAPPAVAGAGAGGESLAMARDDSLQQQLSPLKPAAGEYMDLNKNGQKDPYEDPDLPIEKRIDDLLSKMTVEEKTNQCCTLYGYLRQLKDDLPKPSWKDAIWKDGIANIDEHLSGWKGGRGIGVDGGPLTGNPNVWPPSAHAKAMNEVQRWFIE